ncbi:MAG TPA: acetolactate synthase large subunit [Caulobacteraceae bacterium]|nr:acetolactate synthase large subunit [Caulobacteraceae bacterium]
MNGADAVMQTLADNGVRACFANPGTSEMQFVAALDREPRMRPVLCLFEGVVSGAADGYGRMAGHPAVTLLHLGPGYGNSVANSHNARRAFTPLVNVIGDHATYHQKYDAPLASDIMSLAKPNSRWVKSAKSADDAADLAAEAVQASFGPPGGPASLILPADCAWSPATRKGPVLAAKTRAPPSGAAVDAAAKAIRGAKKPLVLMGSSACGEEGLAAAGRIAATGVRMMADTFLARQPRGAGRFSPERMQYFGEAAIKDLDGVDVMVLAGTKEPVAFFAYPNAPSVLVPDGCAEVTLADQAEDAETALAALADALGAPSAAAPNALSLPDRPVGAIDARSVGASIARHMPDETIISDDSVTSGMGTVMQTRTARHHDWLGLTGGAIGLGIPAAVGAAVACPDRKVVSLNGDGAAAYTVQGLWTLAREKLDVTVVIFANHTYRILGVEFMRTGSGDPGPAAASLLDLGNPRVDWVSIARGFGVPAERCETAERFDEVFASAMTGKGPMLIEVALA